MALDKNLPFQKYIQRELIISSLIGVVIGLFAGLLSQLFWGNYTLALIVSISFFLTIIISSIIAVILPVLFEKYKIDPAVGSGPIATVVRDITNIVVYFLVASFFV